MALDHFSEIGLPETRRCLSARSHPPRHHLVCRSPRRDFPGRVAPASASEFDQASSRPPSAQGPFARRWALPTTRMASWTISEGITPPSSLLRAHAPDQHPPSASDRPLCARSLQVAASPCWLLALPDIISAIFVEVLGPLPRRVRQLHLPISSLTTAASR